MTSLHFLKYLASKSLPEVKSSQYQVFRYARGNRLRKLNEESERLDRILADFQQQREPAMLQDPELFYETKTSVKTIQHEEEAKVHQPVKPKQVPIPELELPITAENQFDRLLQKVMPLHDMPYDMQLKRKHSMNKQVLQKLGLALKEQGVSIPVDSNNLPCVVDYTIPSPITEAYRNKDEFSIRTGIDGNPKTVGFFLESTAVNAETICVRPDKLKIIKDSHKLVAKEFENYIRESPLPPCHNFSDGGHWRNIVVRSNNNGDVMAVVIFHPQNLSEEQINIEKNKLREHFLNKKDILNLKSFYFQSCFHTRCTHDQAPFQLLFGEPFICEEVNGLSFRISPESFFQINTPAASLLYKIILNTSKVKKSTTVLDVCCGIGPISLSLAPHVKQCIGVDISSQAIEDAKMNAAINGIKNVEFHAGRFEYLVRDILNDIFVEELVAIVNPARSSLAKSAMIALRECRYLKKIIFVSCKPAATIPNFVQLCKSGGKKTSPLGPPFHAIRAVPVDLFPHTLHSELVFLLQRV